MRLQFTGLWRNPHFLKLWAGQTISSFGSLITRTALPFTAILVLDATPFQIALLEVADLAPGLMVSLVAGAWVDRLQRRPILVIADLGRAVLLTSIPVAAFLGLLRNEQLYVVAFLSSILSIFFDVAYLSYLPSLVQREDLVEANSKLSASASVAEVGAFGLAGWLVQFFTAPIAVLIDAVTFLVSALFVGLIRAAEPPMPSPSERKSMWQDIVVGLRVVLENRYLRALAGSTITFNASLHIFGTVILLYASRELGFQPGLLGVIFAVGGVSSLLGAVVAQGTSRRLGVGPTMVYGLLLTGLALFFVPLAQGATILAALLLVAQQLLGDAATTVYEINERSLRQGLTPDQLLGRVNASMQFVGLGASLVGSLTGGLLGQTLGLRATMVVGASGVLLAAMWLACSQVRGLKAMPASATEAGPSTV